MEEIWKDIEGYEGFYSVSNLGRVYSRRRERFLTPIITKMGYQRVHLSVDGNVETRAIHRLVAQAFIPNPENKPTVNHINEVKTDNRVENLEWATNLEQNIHGTRMARAIAHTDWKKRSEKIDYALIASKYDHVESAKKQMRPVLQYDMNGNFIARFPGLSAAARFLGIRAPGICECLKGNRRSCGGYKWKYATPDDAALAV